MKYKGTQQKVIDFDFRKNKKDGIGLSIFWKVILGITFAFIVAMIII